MKKNLKKLFAIIMTVAVVLSMAMPAMAEFNATTGTYHLTINSKTNFDKGVKYNIYQLFVANVDSNGAAVYSTEGATGASLIEGKTVKEIADMSADDLWLMARDFETNGVATVGELTTGVPFEITIAGYYLAVPTNLATATGMAGGTVSSPIFVPVPTIDRDESTNKMTVKNDVVATAKDSDVSTDKKISGVTSANGNPDTYNKSSGSTATLGSGDTIHYTITNTVPSYDTVVEENKVNYYVVDKYDDNLQLVADSIKVTSPGTLSKGTLKEIPETSMDGTPYTVYSVTGGDYAIVEDAENHTFTVYFNYSAVKESSSVDITADFILADTAVPGRKIENTSKLTYTNNYYTGDDSTLEDTVKSWTFDFDVYKYDGADNAPLPGAKFGLYKTLGSDGQPDTDSLIKEATSGKDGMVSFGLDLNDGTYYVKELEAPNGYRVDETVYKVVITAEKDGTSGEYTGKATITVNEKEIGTTIAGLADKTFTNPTLGVENTEGTTLPGTGGIGTTIFTFGGLALIVLAGILLVVYTRKQKKA